MRRLLRLRGLRCLIVRRRRGVKLARRGRRRGRGHEAEAEQECDERRAHDEPPQCSPSAGKFTADWAPGKASSLARRGIASTRSDGHGGDRALAGNADLKAGSPASRSAGSRRVRRSRPPPRLGSPASSRPRRAFVARARAAGRRRQGARPPGKLSPAEDRVPGRNPGSPRRGQRHDARRRSFGRDERAGWALNLKQFLFGPARLATRSFVGDE